MPKTPKPAYFTGPVPFDKKGGVPNFVSYYEEQKGTYDFRENVAPFKADLIFAGFSRGRSSANFTLRHPVTDATFEMTAHDLGEAIRGGCLIANGRLEATFAVKKRGANYSIFVLEK